MKQTKTGHLSDQLTVLRNKDVVLDYDISTRFHLAMEEIDAIVMAQRDKFIKDDVIEINETERTKLIQSSRFQALKEKPYFRWAFSFTGIYILALQLRDKESVAFAHTLIQTYIDVACLRHEMKELSQCNNQEEEKKLFRTCNQLINKVMTGDDSTFTFNIRSTDTPREKLSNQREITPFSHPEKRYDPVTQRVWLTLEELDILQSRLDACKPANPIDPSGIVN